jgi:hypothetical protein
MNTKDIDLINVLLIIISLALAFNVPFGLFIFSYVLLGPLHYLTEINWLREKSYFVKSNGLDTGGFRFIDIITVLL